MIFRSCSIFASASLSCSSSMRSTSLTILSCCAASFGSEKEGPTGLLMTTTRSKLHPENETRLLSLPVNDTRQQTTAVMRSIAQRDGRTGKDYSDWHALQVWIAGQDNRVVIPYGEALAEKIPPIDMRIRRDFELLLNAIHAHAIIHQVGRERDEAGRIVATIEDYAVVRELVNDVMSASVQARVGEGLRRVVKAVGKMLDDETKPSVRKLEQALNMSKSVVSRHLKAAMSEGYLVAAQEDSAGGLRSTAWARRSPLILTCYPRSRR